VSAAAFFGGGLLDAFPFDGVLAEFA